MTPASQLIVALLAYFAFALVSEKLTARWLTMPMVVVAFGLMVGAGGAGWLVVDPDNTVIHLLVEATLVLVLFADASRIRVSSLWREAGMPARLLGIGMPLTILLGAAAAMAMFPSWTVWEAALLAAVLAPTDAALGQAVVTQECVPLRVRQALNVESGLNDGIALPVVLVFAAMTAAGGSDAASWLGFWVQQVTLGPATGAAVGLAGGYLLKRARLAAWVDEDDVTLGGLALAALSYLLAEHVGGNGFMAAFAGGMGFGATAGPVRHGIQRFLESEGQLLMVAVFGLLGCALAGPALASATPTTWGYALLSLTVIRMVPVAISLIGTRAAAPTQLFVGWFGPRGLASLLFGLLVIERTDVVRGEEMFVVVVVTVLGSIMLHGVSASWAADRYGAWAGTQQGVMEHDAVSEHPTR